jgi:hypothetical protein
MDILMEFRILDFEHLENYLKKFKIKRFSLKINCQGMLILKFVK